MDVMLSHAVSSDAISCHCNQAVLIRDPFSKTGEDDCPWRKVQPGSTVLVSGEQGPSKSGFFGRELCDLYMEPSLWFPRLLSDLATIVCTLQKIWGSDL